LFGRSPGISHTERLPPWIPAFAGTGRDRAVGPLRELDTKKVAGRLAVGTWQREVVVGLLADDPGHTHDRECDHQPECKDPHGVTGAKVPQTVEQRRQHAVLMTRGPWIVPSICISIGSPNGSILARNRAAHPSNGAFSACELARASRPPLVSISACQDFRFRNLFAELCCLVCTWLAGILRRVWRCLGG
jgi:hypothetical protein